MHSANVRFAELHVYASLDSISTPLNLKTELSGFSRQSLSILMPRFLESAWRIEVPTTKIPDITHVRIMTEITRALQLFIQYHVFRTPAPCHYSLEKVLQGAWILWIGVNNGMLFPRGYLHVQISRYLPSDSVYFHKFISELACFNIHSVSKNSSTKLN